MTENEIVTLCAVLSKVLFELCWRLGLDVADLRAQAVANPHEPVVRTAIPRSVRDWTRRQQRDTKVARICEGAFFASSGARECEQHDVDDCAKTTCATVNLLHNALGYNGLHTCGEASPAKQKAADCRGQRPP